MLAHDFPGQKKEATGFTACHLSGANACTSCRRSLSLPAPRVITWVALGGLEELSSSLLGFY